MKGTAILQPAYVSVFSIEHNHLKILRTMFLLFDLRFADCEKLILTELPSSSQIFWILLLRIFFRGNILKSSQLTLSNSSVLILVRFSESKC